MSDLLQTKACLPHAASIAGALIFFTTCQPAAPPCTSADACSKQEECLASRCVAVGHIQVAPSSIRLVSAPDAMAVLSNGKPVARLPKEVFFGREEEPQTLLLRFPAAWGDGRVEAAFLVLEPNGSTPAWDATRIEVSVANTEWTPSTLEQELPATSGPRAEEVALSRTLPLRLDVTTLIHAGTGRHRAFAVSASESTATGVTYGLGWPEGQLPKLEVYVSPAQRKARSGS